MEKQNGITFKIDNNRRIDGVTFDAIAAEKMLGISASQLSTLVNKGIGCNGGLCYIIRNGGGCHLYQECLLCGHKTRGWK